MPERPGFLGSPFVRVTLYYIVLGLAVWGLLTLFPVLEDAFSAQRLESLAETGLMGGREAGATGETMRTGTELLLFTFIAITGALLLLVPVMWVYMVTRQRQGYDESLVHTVVILPVAVTGLVIVVQDSVALAFSLAGIVAAVRFRNTLKDTKDAVYIFLAIGTALAAGVQALGIAAVSTIFFNYLILVMWKFQIGNIYADQLARAPRMKVGDVLAGAGHTPGAGIGKLTIGSPGLLQALTPETLERIKERRDRLRKHIEASGKAAKKSGLLVVVTDDADGCQEAITNAIRHIADHCSLADVDHADDGLTTLEYLVGAESEEEGVALIDTLRRLTGRCVLAAQYRNLKVEKAKDGESTYWTLPED